MKLNDMQKQYDNLETAIDKYNFWKDIQTLHAYMEQDFKDNIIWCSCCKMPIYIKDLLRTLDFWKETTYVNSFGGLEKGEYKEEEFLEFRYNCPKCNI